MKNEQPSVKSRVSLTAAQITELVRPLIDIVTKYYKDPENERAFQEWLKQQENMSDS